MLRENPGRCRSRRAGVAAASHSSWRSAWAAKALTPMKRAVGFGLVRSSRRDRVIRAVGLTGCRSHADPVGHCGGVSRVAWPTDGIVSLPVRTFQRHAPNERRQRMGTITTTDGTEIFYKDWGSGQPIVFSYGSPLSADDWDTQMLFFLQHGYRVIAHDRRGHGRSTQTVRPLHECRRRRARHGTAPRCSGTRRSSDGSADGCRGLRVRRRLRPQPGLGWFPIRFRVWPTRAARCRDGGCCRIRAAGILIARRQVRGSLSRT